MAPCRRFHAQFWQLLFLAFIAANGGTWGDTSILTTNIKASTSTGQRTVCPLAEFQDSALSAATRGGACPPFQHPACLLSLVAPAYIPPTPLVCLSLQNFPSSRGSVVGVLKAAIGLSGARSHASAVQAFGIANWVKCVFLKHRRHPLVHNMPGGQHAIALPTALLASPCRLPVCVGLLGSVLWGQGLLPAVPGAGPGGGGPAGAALGEQLKKSSMMCAWGSAGRSF